MFSDDEPSLENVNQEICMEVPPEYIITVALDIATEVQLETPEDVRVMGRRKAQQRLFESAVAGDIIQTEFGEENGRRFSYILVYDRSKVAQAQS
jgi:hypothetical protein